MISQELKDSTRGRWKQILMGIGVDGKLLNGLHQPCPFCGGSDRFRFTDHESDGGYYCNQCGSGTPFHLASRILDKGYPEICKMVEQIVGSGRLPNRAQVEDQAAKADWVRKIWEESVDLAKDDPVCRYLIGRGLKMASTTLKFNPEVFDGAANKKMPTMVAPINGPDDDLIGIHLTHLEESAPGKWIKAQTKVPKKQRKIAHTISGGAIRLWKMDPNNLALAEGIETALAVKELFRVNCWSVVTATGMEKFQLPTVHPLRLTIYADLDHNFTGLKAAYILANRLAIKDGFSNVFVEKPMAKGDFLDELNGYHGGA